jgi:hypothetical protein
MNNIFNHSWKKYLIWIVYVLVILVIHNFAYGTWDLLILYSNGLFIGGASLFCISLLIIVGNFGAFDTFSFLVNGKKEGCKTLYDYTEKVKEKRKNKKFNFIPSMVVSIITIMISIVILYA